MMVPHHRYFPIWIAFTYLLIFLMSNEQTSRAKARNPKKLDSTTLHFLPIGLFPHPIPSVFVFFWLPAAYVQTTIVQLLHVNIHVNNVV